MWAKYWVDCFDSLQLFFSHRWSESLEFPRETVSFVFPRVLMFSETKSRETSGLSGSDIKCILSGFMRVLAFYYSKDSLHFELKLTDSRLGLMISHEMSPRTHYSGLEIKKNEVAFFRPVNRGFIKHQRSENSPSTTHNSLVKFQRSMAIFYSEESDLCICHANVKRNYSQKCIILEMHK